MTSRVMSGLFSKFDSAFGSDFDPGARTAIVRASSAILLARVVRVSCRIRFRLDDRMRAISSVSAVVILDNVVEGESATAYSDWNQFSRFVLSRARRFSPSSVRPPTSLPGIVSNPLQMIQETVGETFLEKFRSKLQKLQKEALELSRQNREEELAAAQFRESQRAVQVYRLRKWASSCVGTEFVTKEDFAAVYDELLVRDLIRS